MHETGFYPIYQGPGISLDANTRCPSAAKRQFYGEMGSEEIEGSKRSRAEIPAYLMSVWKKKKDVTYLHIDNLASFFLPQDTSHDWLLIRGQQEILW